MAIALTLSNILQFFSFIAPTLLIFFLFLSSLFNQNLKGLVYIAGILVSSTLNIIFMNIVGSEVSDDASFSCNLFDIPHVSKYNSPYPSTLIIAFTIAYLVLPMKYNKQMNYVVLIFLLCLLGVDIMTKVQNKCTTYPGTILGALVGFLFGAVWYILFYSMGYSSLLYFDELRSDNVQCSMPTKQTFKCSVYKNGQLISSNTV
jgi:hypothetical protein